MKNIYHFALLLFLPCISTGQNDHIGNTANSDNQTSVKLTLCLEGPYQSGKMNTDLNKAGLLPLSQPFSVPPWNYPGTESVPAIPNGNVVDWILVELRSADSASVATPQTAIARKAGFLMANGVILNIDGTTLLSFDSVFT